MTTASTPTKDIAASAALAAAGLASFAIASLAAPCALLGAAYVASRLRDPEAGTRTSPAPLRRAPSRPMADGDEGTHCIGVERDTGRQVWMSDVDMLRHLAFVGSSGSGKSMVLHALEANALARASGFLHVDAKMDIATFARVSALAKRMGREDDLMLVDFAGFASEAGNTFNPLSSGDARVLADLVADTFTAEPQHGRFTAVPSGPLLAPLAALVHLRDNHGEGLTLATLAEALDLDALVRLRGDARLPAHAVAALSDMLSGMPGWQGDTPTAETREAHGRLLGTVRDGLVDIAGRHPRILGRHRADVDMRDVVARRRILVVTLPNLWRTGATNAVLGRLVLASLKATVAAMAEAERERHPADRREPVSPFLATLDDAALYAVPGMDRMGRDATAANVSLAYALGMGHGTPLLAPEVGSPLRGVGAMALMRMEDMRTLDQAMRVAARLAPPDVLGLQGGTGMRALPPRHDIASQGEGEMHLCTMGACVRMRSMHFDTQALCDLDRLVVSPVSTLDLGEAAPSRRGTPS